MFILVLGANCIATCRLVMKLAQYQNWAKEPKSYLTTDNPQNICERGTTTQLQNVPFVVTHRCSEGYLFKLMIWFLHGSSCTVLT